MSLTPILGRYPYSGTKRDSDGSPKNPEQSSTIKLAQTAFQRAISGTPLTSPAKGAKGTPVQQVSSDAFRTCPDLPTTSKPKKSKIKETMTTKALWGKSSSTQPAQKEEAKSTQKKGPPFPNPMKIIAGAELENFPIPQGPSLYARTTLTYSAAGILRNLCKQHSATDCGATAILMLLTDIVRKTDKALPIADEFWRWYSTCELADASQIARHAKNDAGIELAISKAPQDTPLEHLKTLIDSSGYPVISGITHPQLHGHWIVVDRINDTHTYIRDPKTGGAYMIPNEIMSTYYDEEITEFVLNVANVL